MSDRVYAAVEPVERSRSYTSKHGVPVETGGFELLDGNYPVLPSRDLGS
ncbi:MAG: hypothetical protein AABM29_03135 [Actinomycetota bacterium]